MIGWCEENWSDFDAFSDVEDSLDLVAASESFTADNFPGASRETKIPETNDHKVEKLLEVAQSVGNG